MTPVKGSKTPRRSKLPAADPVVKVSENSNPNSSTSTNPRTPVKILKSPHVASPKLKSSMLRNPSPVPSPVAVKERKCLVAKNGSKMQTNAKNPDCRCGNSKKKCTCVVRNDLHASQKEFVSAEMGVQGKEREMSHLEGLKGNCGISETGAERQDFEQSEMSPEMGTAKIRKIRQRLMEEVRNSLPESGIGRVIHLVKAFEKLVLIPHPSASKAEEGGDEKEKQKVMKWALPGLPMKAEVTPDINLSASTSCSQPDFIFTSKSTETGSSVSASKDSSNESCSSINSRAFGAGRRSPRNSSGSSNRTCGSKWKKKLRATCQQPFKLRTEQRGTFKQEEFNKQVEEIFLQEQKQRLPIAQGLPCTTEQPEFLVKPPVKESTRPIDFQLHSDLRALERAEFDQLMAEKMWSIEQYRIEREKQKKAEEEEEIRRVRRELVPKAQPMPYFDRPFIPKKKQCKWRTTLGKS